MKEIIDLYCRKCKIRENSSANFRTAAYKVGKAKNAQSRDTKDEFARLQNANPKSNDGSSKKVEVDVARDLEISGPPQFIDELEGFIVRHYFSGDQMYFDTKQEYVSSYHETSKKYEHLLEVLKSKETDLIKLNKGYKDLDDKQVNLLSILQEQYTKFLEDIKSTLNKFLTPLAVQPPTVTKPVVKIPTAVKAGTVDIYSVLTSDFILLKSQGKGKYMLMHNSHHKGKDPADPKGAWTVDINLGNKPKFQFHNTDIQQTYGYKQGSISAAKTIRIFGSNVLDYDDPNFDRSKLPH